MPAVIQNLPTFNPFSFEQYIAPLNEYKTSYDALETAYNTVELQASALESLVANDPDSNAYARYNQYATDLRNEADQLAMVGLTPGSRKRLHNMKTRYAKELVPIQTGYAKWEEAKKRFDSLKPGEIMSYNPYEMGIDDFIGENPDFRNFDLEKIRDNAEKAAKAHSMREFYTGVDENLTEDIRRRTNNIAIDNVMGFLNGTEELAKQINDVTSLKKYLLNGTDKNKVDKNNPLVQSIVAQLQGIDLSKMSNSSRKQILNQVMFGTLTGLVANEEYKYLAQYSPTLRSGGSGISVPENENFIYALNGVEVDEDLLAQRDEKLSEIDDVYNRNTNRIQGILNSHAGQNNLTYSDVPQLSQQKLQDFNKLREQYGLMPVESITEDSYKELRNTVSQLYNSGIFANRAPVLNTQSAKTILSMFNSRLSQPVDDTKDMNNGAFWMVNEKGKKINPFDEENIKVYQSLLEDSNTKVMFNYDKKLDNGKAGVITLYKPGYRQRIEIRPDVIFNADAGNIAGGVMTEAKRQLEDSVMHLNPDNAQDVEMANALKTFIDKGRTYMDLWETLTKLKKVKLSSSDASNAYYKSLVFNTLNHLLIDPLVARSGLQLQAMPDSNSAVKPTERIEQ